MARPPPFCHLPAFAPAREGDELARDEALRELGRAYGYAPCELPADALLCLFTKGAAKMEEFLRFWAKAKTVNHHDIRESEDEQSTITHR